MSQSSHVSRTARAVDTADCFKKPTKSIGKASFTCYWSLTMLVFALCVLVAMPAFATTNRVTEGQQVLYTFNEGSGSTVRDVSGVGTPLNLTIQDPAATRWISGGLAINAPTIITSAGASSKVINAVKASNAITIEAWQKPANLTQGGPARIVTLSETKLLRNFALGQEQSAYQVRLRTTATDNAGKPELSSPTGVVSTALTHVIYTRDAQGNAKLYVNGVEKARMTVTGNTSNWNDSYRLALANEFNEPRAWLGELHLVAIYNRALSPAQVSQNFNAGPNASSPSQVRITEGQQVLYTFNEGSGSTVRDVSGVGTPLNLTIQDPAATRWISGGLAINAPTIITSAGAPSKVINAVKASNAITIETWQKPANLTQGGPARIVTLSETKLLRNFALGQEQSAYQMRLRTTATDNAGKPELSSPTGVVSTALTHVVYTRDAQGNAKLYVNGVEKARMTVTGNTSNWNDSYRLALANEFNEPRAWLGELRLVAIYNRALSPAQVSQNFNAGPQSVPSGNTSDENDTSSDGTSSDGTSSDGTSSDGTSSDGTSSDGTSSDGTSSDGTTDTETGCTPVAKHDIATTNETIPVNINVLANDLCLGSTPITVSVMGSPSNGTASVQSDNTIKYTPNGGFAGQDSFNYRVTDGNSNSAIATVTINVNCISCPANVNLTLQWNPNPDNILGYRVYYGVTPSTATNEISDLYISSGDVDAESPSVTYDASNDLSLRSGDTVCFRVKAYSNIGESEYSEAVCENI